MIHKRKNNDKQDNEGSRSQEEYPEWIVNHRNRNRISSKNKSEHGSIPQEREILIDRSRVSSDGDSKRRRNERESNDRAMRVRRPKLGKAYIGKIEERDGETRLGKLDITLSDLRLSLSDEILETLLDRSFNPNQIATLRYNITGLSKLAEDSLRGSIQRKPIIRSAKKPDKNPSVKYIDMYKRFVDGELAPDAHIVFGRYLILYKENFGEEDPEFVGKPINGAISKINEMSSLLVDNDFTKLIDYINKIIPLWANQLKKGADFPNGRPTFNALFIKRNIWSQRFNLVRRWKIDGKSKI
jgi:hypothetical protein